MKNKNLNIFIKIGMAIYVLLTVIDRFFYKIPDIIYIPALIIGIIFLLYGICKEKKSR